MTIPDVIDENWSDFEEGLKREVNRRIDVSSEKLRQTFTRYKSIMEKAIVRE
jgi:hypothetical protein